jgi:hypothetical protein
MRIPCEGSSRRIAEIREWKQAEWFVIYVPECIIIIMRDGETSKCCGSTRGRKKKGFQRT